MAPGRFLPEFELYVLLAVGRLSDDAYGVAVRREIESRTGRSVSVGSLYTTMARLEKKGLLVTRDDPEEPTGRGRPRRLCAVTEKGREAVRHSLEMLGRMADGVGFASDFGGGAE